MATIKTPPLRVLCVFFGQTLRPSNPADPKTLGADLLSSAQERQLPSAVSTDPGETWLTTHVADDQSQSWRWYITWILYSVSVRTIYLKNRRN